MPIRLIDVAHKFPGQRRLFSNINLSLESGDVLALTGPSGSGKSTLLSIIAGWLAPMLGRVEVPTGTVTAWVFQNPHGVAQRTALDHVVLPIIARGIPRATAEIEAMRFLESFHLTTVARRRFSDLSGGEAQRLMLARATARVSVPSDDAGRLDGLMLVDEPTAQLDPANAGTVIESMHSLAGLGAVVIIATHDPRVSERCSRVLDLGSLDLDDSAGRDADAPA